MLAEKARVVALEEGALWVETQAQSSCGSCAGNQDCGTGLLQRYLQTSRFLRINLPDSSQARYRIGDELELGLDESVMVRGSIQLYILPLLGLLAGAALGASLGGELLSILGGLVGLLGSGLALRWFAWKHRFNPDYHPVILEESAIVSRSTPT